MSFDFDLYQGGNTYSRVVLNRMWRSFQLQNQKKIRAGFSEAYLLTTDP